MNFKKVGVIGLGLIGGSVAGSLKKSGKVNKVIGVDRNKDTLDYAINNAIVDEISLQPDKSIYDSDIVVIATHVNSIPEVASSLSVSENTLVTDVGSVKESIVKTINNTGRFSFIGSHPIAGSEKSGIYNSQPEMFKDKICITTPTSVNNSEQYRIIKEFWEITGCSVIKMEPEVHDRIFAYVSHLPHAVAFSLINAFIHRESYLGYAGGGLRDFTRISHSSPEMWTEIFLMNKEHVLDALKDYINSLDRLVSVIEEDDSVSLCKYLTEVVELISAGSK